MKGVPKHVFQRMEISETEEKLTFLAATPGKPDDGFLIVGAVLL